MRGPKPFDRPAFPAEFLAEAQALLRRRTVAFQLRQRAALVCLLRREPQISHVEAALRTQMGIGSVRRWRRRWALGKFSLDDEPGRGRKPDFSPARSGRRASPGLRNRL